MDNGNSPLPTILIFAKTQVDIIGEAWILLTNPCQTGQSESRSFYKEVDETINSICGVASRKLLKKDYLSKFIRNPAK